MVEVVLAVWMRVGEGLHKLAKLDLFFTTEGTEVFHRVAQSATLHSVFSVKNLRALCGKLLMVPKVRTTLPGCKCHCVNGRREMVNVDVRRVEQIPRNDFTLLPIFKPTHRCV